MSAPPATVAAPARRVAMFESLKIRDFRFLWVSNLAATFAMQMQMVARGWLVYDMTSSPLALNWVMLSFMLPSFVFSLAGGVIADRMHKKWVMIAAQVLNAGATILLAWIIYSGQITFWHFIYFGLFNGTVLSFSMPARSSVIPEIVERASLVNAMALQSATFNLSRVLGPALAGALIAWFAGGDTTSTSGVGIVFFVIAGLYVASVLATMLLHYQGAPVQPRQTSMLADVREGLAYMRNERLVLALLLMNFVPMTFGFTATFLLPAFNHDVIGGGPEDLGFMMTAMGVGALAGSLVLARIGDTNGKGRVLFVTGYLWALLLASFALSDNLPLAMIFLTFMGLFSAIFGSMNMSIVQLSIDSEIRGRVMSIMMMAFGLMPLGVLPVSAAAELVGIDTALLLAAGMLALSVLVLGALFPGLRRIDRGYEDPAPG